MSKFFALIPDKTRSLIHYLLPDSVNNESAHPLKKKASHSFNIHVFFSKNEEIKSAIKNFFTLERRRESKEFYGDRAGDIICMSSLCTPGKEPPRLIF